MATRGAFIVFEGIDRCGKTTQSLKLVENLKKLGIPTKHMRFPGACSIRTEKGLLKNRTTDTGKALDSYLRCASDTEDHSIHLLFSANRWEVKDRLKKDLLEGTTLIIDRYAYSGAAYTASKGYDLQWCKNPDVGLPRPDMIIFLDISVEDAMKRGEFGQERYEKKDIQERVRELFHEMKEDNWKVVDANQDKEAIETQLLQIATELQEKIANEPIKELWVQQNKCCDCNKESK